MRSIVAPAIAMSRAARSSMRSTGAASHVGLSHSTCQAPYKPPAKKAAARAVKAKTPVPVVTLKHIAAEIAEAHEVPKTRAETMLADTVDRLARHLVKGNKVRIVGLGIFQVKRREARMGRNPQTGEAVKIKASKKVTFRAGKELKEAV
jgi:DNA-binding protein HU-beta